ncbi:MAG: imelysin family protein [Bacteroidota bacterium]
MKSNFIFYLSIFSLVTFWSCSNDDETTTPTPDLIDRTTVAANYANIVLTNYQDALADAQLLKAAIDAFVADPTETNFQAAKTAWLNSRESYGPSEAFRFANGPIDSGDTEDIEGWLNSWPLDEAYIDYVDGDEGSGFINDTSFEINKANLITQNGVDGDENVTIGYHAIEFLLWGQDLTDPNSNQAGLRPYTDFVDGGTAQNQDRRRVYIAVCAELIIEHLQVMVDEWSGSYKNTFLALNSNTAIDNMLSSIAELSRSELAIERMAVALEEQNQEDEHSCFSDNTHRDIRLNWNGVVNVYRGTYGSISGNSLQDLIQEADASLAAELSTLLSNASTTVNATGIPFDRAISGGDSTSEGMKVLQAVQALVAFGDKLLEARPVLGLN